jgi:ribose transport system substrate-binding protein
MKRSQLILKQKTTDRTDQWKIGVCVFMCILVMQVFSPAPSPVFASDSPTSADAQETYVMVSFARGNEFFAWAFAGMHDAAALLGPHVKVEWQGPKPFSEGGASLEANILKETIKRKITGIVVSAAEKNIFKPVINEAIDAGIPVICFDSDVPESKRLAIVATDNYYAGYLSGEAMAEWLNGHGPIGVLTLKNTIHLEERMRGFKDGMARTSPETEIFVIEKEGGFSFPYAELVYDYKILLKAHPEIRGLFGPWAHAGRAAAEAVRDLNLTGVIQILSFDFDPLTIQAIEQGEIRATVAQNPYLMGYYSMLLAYSAAHPTGIPSTHQGFGHVPASIDTGVSIIGKDAVQMYKNVPKVTVLQEPPLEYAF